MRTLALLFALFAVLLFAFPDESAAADGRRAREGVQAGEVLPLDRLLPRIRQQQPGQLSDVQGPFAGPRGAHYRVKWLTPDGRVIWLDTDARTGQVLGVRGDSRSGNRPRRNDAPRESRRGNDRDDGDGQTRNFRNRDRGEYDGGDRGGGRDYRRGRNDGDRGGARNGDRGGFRGRGGGRRDEP